MRARNRFKCFISLAFYFWGMIHLALRTTCCSSTLWSYGWLMLTSRGKGHQGLYIPWKVTGMLHSTSALAISVRSLALRIRRYPGLWEPGATTMVSSTPGDQHVRSSRDQSYQSMQELVVKRMCFCVAVKYRRLRLLHQVSGQTGAQRGTSPVLATPRSPWFSH